LYSRGQDIHFSQFYETAIVRNPALTGIYTEDYKVTGQFREQWGSVGKGFRTGAFSAEYRFPVSRSTNDFLTMGFLGYSDKAGTINFKTVGLYPSINFNKSMEDAWNSYLSVGFTAGHLTRTIDVTKMTFDNQYQNGSFNSGNGTGEQQLPDPKLNYWDLGAGVSFNSSPSDKASYYIGASAYHFTRPRTSFYQENDDVRLQTRWNGNAGFSWFIDDDYSVLFHGNYVMQGPYRELIAGGLFKWSMTDHRNRKSFALAGGAFYRLHDAIVPVVKVDWKGQSFSFSYDVNISTLRDVTKMRGGFEITVAKAGFIGAGPEDKRLCPRF
jgi:type IX secretion system PorP/SprF family membrane protein